MGKADAKRSQKTKSYVQVCNTCLLNANTKRSKRVQGQSPRYRVKLDSSSPIALQTRQVHKYSVPICKNDFLRISSRHLDTTVAMAILGSLSIIDVPLTLAAGAAAYAAYCIYHSRFRPSKSKPNTCPISVNYHFSRQCNYSCGFCFHTAITSYKCNTSDAKRGLRLLHEAGMRKINFAGGEPFLHPHLLGAMLEYW